MRRTSLRAALAVAVWVAAAPCVSAAADSAVAAVRAGDHVGYGRVVLDLPAGFDASPDIRTGADNVVVVRLPGLQLGPVVPKPPRNVVSLRLAADALRLQLRPGARLRTSHPPDKLVLDISDPPPDAASITPSPDALLQSQAVASAERPIPRPRRVPDAGGAPPATVAVVPRPARDEPVSPVRVAPAPARPSEFPASAAPDPKGSAAPTAVVEATLPAPTPIGTLLPIDPAAGVAFFPRGRATVLVADADAAADVGAWHSVPGFENAKITALPHATLVVADAGTSPLPKAVCHDRAGWSLCAAAASGTIEPAIRPHGLWLPAAGASRVVSIADPLGGGTLLVGTVAPEAAASVAMSKGEAGRGGTEDGVAIAGPRRLPRLVLIPTWRGVAVEVLADTVDMRRSDGGFLTDTGADDLAPAMMPSAGVAAPPVPEMARFDLPALPTAALRNRLDAATAAAGTAPPRTRAAAQVGVAQAMLALGMGAEAQAMLRLAADADGRVGTRPDVLALGGLAAILAGRPAEASGLDDPALAGLADAAGGRGDVALWRALRAVRSAESSGRDVTDAEAKMLADQAHVLASYPQTLRARLVPWAADALAGKRPDDAAKLIAQAGDLPGLDFARAVLEEHEGHVDEALRRLDHLAGSPDRREHARAAGRAVELRLASGRITPGQAAAALDALIAAWRGGEAELALRWRVGALRLRAGDIRGSVAALREAAQPPVADDWPPERAAEARDRLRTGFRAAVELPAAAQMPPLDFLAMVEENAALLPDGEAGRRVAEGVADRLAALDLPERTESVLQRLIDAAPAGAARATLGGRLAQLQLEGGNPAAALTTLSATTNEDLSPAIQASRTLLYARATAARGDLDAATGALAALDRGDADGLSAQLLEQAGHWPEAAAVLRRALLRSLQASSPDAPQLVPLQTAAVLPSDTAALAVHLASVAAQTGQDSDLRLLRDSVLPRLAPGRDADALRLLTSAPLHSVADLPRAARDATFARLMIRQDSTVPSVPHS